MSIDRYIHLKKFHCEKFGSRRKFANQKNRRVPQKPSFVRRGRGGFIMNPLQSPFIRGTENYFF